MDGKLWQEVYRVVMSVDYTSSTRNFTHDDRTIVLVFLRATADDKTVLWACQPENWAGLTPPPTWPSQPTMSRRLRTESVQALLEAVFAWLAKHASNKERTIPLDGRALTVSGFSKDPDARWGYATNGFAKGYKLHAIWGSGPVPVAWDVRPLNASESATAKQLVPKLERVNHKCYLLGDCSYDTNPLHEVTSQQGYQLLSPQKRKGKLGHRRHHPARVASLAMLETPYGARLYAQRQQIERNFGHCAVRAEGLDQLPAHVRRLPRVKRFVHAKLILNGFRILSNRNQLNTTPA